MIKYKDDEEYLCIINSIIENDKFKKMGDIKHHNTTRLNHLIKVSYYSYKISKFLKLDYHDTARGGLLHDFYIEEISNCSNVKDKIKLFTIQHPKEALVNSKEICVLSDKEANIIESHMFPVNYKVPKYAESWIVSFVDKGLSFNEFFNKFKYKFICAFNLYLIFILNTIK